MYECTVKTAQRPIQQYQVPCSALLQQAVHFLAKTMRPARHDIRLRRQAQGFFRTVLPLLSSTYGQTQESTKCAVERVDMGHTVLLLLLLLLLLMQQLQHCCSVRGKSVSGSHLLMVMERSVDSVYLLAVTVVAAVDAGQMIVTVHNHRRLIGPRITCLRGKRNTDF